MPIDATLGLAFLDIEIAFEIVVLCLFSEFSKARRAFAASSQLSRNRDSDEGLDYCFGGWAFEGYTKGAYGGTSRATRLRSLCDICLTSLNTPAVMQIIGRETAPDDLVRNARTSLSLWN
jgi:hypothetical protein